MRKTAFFPAEEELATRNNNKAAGILEKRESSCFIRRRSPKDVSKQAQGTKGSL
ncbi:hypothetical protein [Paenibacillus sp. OAS669]|uniref:hypothetical protein n=1 Tax=Paenibacillus sp. OAS669 TaxID=2663821 RepID=UPI00178A4D90|nr:hypothetical protein [Paenibacillus sp. OAS669]MBE1444457.1 hypothetical protein [Paenibacillus sp. OAS669]